LPLEQVHQQAAQLALEGMLTVFAHVLKFLGNPIIVFFGELPGAYALCRLQGPGVKVGVGVGHGGGSFDKRQLSVYNPFMIEGFRDKRLKYLYERGDSSKIPPALVERVEFILALLDVALTLDDINVHSLHLHPLTGSRKGFWSVTVRANWRIIFRFENGNAFDIEFVDYH
jgi:toxin HigB-1